MGHLFVITSGGVDLSLDSIMKTSMVVFMLFNNVLGPEWLLTGIAVSLLIGVGIGAINGLLITRLNVNPFLLTLFTGIIFNSIRRILTGVSPMGQIPARIAFFVKGEKAGQIPHAVFILLAVTVITYIAVNKTVFGRKMMLSGTSPAAADFSGIRVRRIQFISYLIAGGAAVLSSIVVAGYIGYVDQETLATGMAFESLIAVVLGGNILGGGKPTVIGALGGALATTLLINIVVLFGYQIQHQYMFKGIILILVILVSSYVNSKGFTLRNFGISRIKKIKGELL
jgi:ribose transport system permease protein